jgi:AraC-like DNA-binding protein
LISTLHGLYIYFEGGVKEIIPRIEFNKHGLSVHEELIFAGSIEGLYVLDKGMLLNNVLKSLQETEFKDKRQLQFNTGVILLVIALIVIAYLVYQNLKKKKESLRLMRKGTTINPETIRQIVLENPKIISVEAIAEYFETSTVQLNRVLKKYDTSGLAVLKSIKQDIVKEMIEQDKSLEEISKRVGYSINYIKRNLL